METTPTKKRLAWPMLLLHLVAWGVVLAVGLAFVFANVKSRCDWGQDRHEITDRIYIESGFGPEYGWPWIGLECVGILTDSFTPIAPPSLYPICLIFNVVVGLLIVSATFFVFVFPLLRRKLFQVKLVSLFILTATVAVFCSGYRVTNSFKLLDLIDPPSYFPDSGFFYRYSLYLQIPLGLGIGCAIYMGIWIAVRLVTALVRILSKRQPVTQSE